MSEPGVAATAKGADQRVAGEFTGEGAADTLNTGRGRPVPVREDHDAAVVVDDTASHAVAARACYLAKSRTLA